MPCTAHEVTERASDASPNIARLDRMGGGEGRCVHFGICQCPLDGQWAPSGHCCPAAFSLGFVATPWCACRGGAATVMADTAGSSSSKEAVSSCLREKTAPRKRKRQQSSPVESGPLIVAAVISCQ
eukprot:15442677-Alexandrium_andersonii.AAC.1